MFNQLVISDKICILSATFDSHRTFAYKYTASSSHTHVSLMSPSPWSSIRSLIPVPRDARTIFSGLELSGVGEVAVGRGTLGSV